ncbi:MAG: hypothetical protein AAF386_01565 [Pseudomonadota bacterium]
MIHKTQTGADGLVSIVQVSTWGDVQIPGQIPGQISGIDALDPSEPIELSLAPFNPIGAGWIAISPAGVTLARLHVHTDAGAPWRVFALAHVTVSMRDWRSDPHTCLARLIDPADGAIPDLDSSSAGLVSAGALDGDRGIVQRWGFETASSGAQMDPVRHITPLLTDAMARDGLAAGLTGQTGGSDTCDFETACTWFDATFRKPNAAPSQDRGRDKMRQALSLAQFQTDIFMPSALLDLSQFPVFARAFATLLTDRLARTVSPVRLAAVTAWMLDDISPSPTFLAARLRTQTWTDVQFAKWAMQSDVLRAVMKALASDPCVADIDGTWGRGAALSLGQHVTKRLRDMGPHHGAKLAEMPTWGMA